MPLKSGDLPISRRYNMVIDVQKDLKRSACWAREAVLWFGSLEISTPAERLP